MRLIARRTWRFFETFVTPADNMLPPDNFQEDPKPVVAHRTSPTNIGLYLLSAVAARDFGWAGTLETRRAPGSDIRDDGKHAALPGHFYNWYDTRDLQPLDRAYVSSVDSGNLAGHLIALANACEEWHRPPRRRRDGRMRALADAPRSGPRGAGQRCPPTGKRRLGGSSAPLLDEIEGPADAGARQLDRAIDLADPQARSPTERPSWRRQLAPRRATMRAADLVFWIEPPRAHRLPSMAAIGSDGASPRLLRRG